MSQNMKKQTKQNRKKKRKKKHKKFHWPFRIVDLVRKPPTTDKPFQPFYLFHKFDPDLGSTYQSPRAKVYSREKKSR